MQFEFLIRFYKIELFCDIFKDLPNNDSMLNDINLDNSITNSLIENSGNVTCGVCKKSMEEQFWMKHIEEEHFYLAWKETDKELVSKGLSNFRIL